MTYDVTPIDPAHLDRVRQQGDDGHGNVLVSRAAGGGEPLRCCLRNAGAHESIALIGYAPDGTGGGYREVGPVFVHADHCDGPAALGYPTSFTDRQQVFRAYDVSGAIAGALLVPAGDHDVAVKELFADPAVVEIHTRNVLYGCYMLRITRPPTAPPG